MTTKQIEGLRLAETKKLEIKFETAKRIRELLDTARKEYGSDAADEDDLESTIIELATSEE